MSVTETKTSLEVRREVRRRFASADEAAQFARLLDEAVEDATQRFERGESPCISIAEGMDDFLSHQKYIEANAASTVGAYRRRLERFVAAFGNVPLSSITREMVYAWLRDRLGDEGNRRTHHPDRRVCRDTVNQDLKALRRFARWAVEVGRAPSGLDLVLVRPLKISGKVRGNRFVPKALVRHEFMQIVRALARAGYEHLAFVLEGMQLFMLREEALFRLTPAHVAMPTRQCAGAIDAPAVKHGPDGSIAVPFGSRKHDLLRRLVEFFRQVHGRQPRKREPLFVTRRGRSTRRRLGWSTDVFGHELRRVCDRLGYADFTAYQARHSIISWLQQQEGVSLADIQAAARHMRISTQEVYSHRSGVDGLSAYEAAERYMSRDADAVQGERAALECMPAMDSGGGESPRLQNIAAPVGCGD